jgi:hypothetical protein
MEISLWLDRVCQASLFVSISFLIQYVEKECSRRQVEIGGSRSHVFLWLIISKLYGLKEDMTPQVLKLLRSIGGRIQ